MNRRQLKRLIRETIEEQLLERGGEFSPEAVKKCLQLLDQLNQTFEKIEVTNDFHSPEIRKAGNKFQKHEDAMREILNGLLKK